MSAMKWMQMGLGRGTPDFVLDMCRGCTGDYRAAVKPSADGSWTFSWWKRNRREHRREHIVSDCRTYATPDMAMAACEANLAKWRADMPMRPASKKAKV